MEHLLGILRVPTRLGLSLPEIGRLLGQGSQLSHPLWGGSKLGAHISAQPGLLGEAVPFHLLLMEELGFLLAMSNEGLKRRPVSKIQKYTKKEESEREDQADTWPVGMMTSRRMPLA